MSNFTRTFFILLAGMSLTFFGMALLWGMMVLSERIFKKKPEKKAVKTSVSKYDLKEESKTLAAVAAVASALALQENRKAASAAVATALTATYGISTPEEFLSVAMSSWVVSHRQEQNNLRNQIYIRKSRGD